MCSPRLQKKTPHPATESQLPPGRRGRGTIVRERYAALVPLRRSIRIEKALQFGVVGEVDGAAAVEIKRLAARRRRGIGPAKAVVKALEVVECDPIITVAIARYATKQQ